MKRIIIYLMTVVSCLSIYAHPGRTDSDGGHNDNSAGEYHYHHGYPAHQHPNGVCPYDYDNNTTNASSKSSIARESKDKTKEVSLITVIETVSLVGGIGYVIAYFLGPTIKENQRRKNK